MWRSGVVLMVVAGWSLPACAGQVYDAYVDYYASDVDAAFAAVEARRDFVVQYASENDAEALSDDAGGWIEHVETMNGATLEVVIRQSGVAVNGAGYRFEDAIAFPGESPAGWFHMPGFEIFVSAGNAWQPTAICIQNTANGSGESSRHVQVYLLGDPLRQSGAPRFFRFPSLFASCRALRSEGGEWVFPRNLYRLGAAQNRIGVRFQYFRTQSDAFVANGRDVVARFPDPDNVYRFEIVEPEMSP